MKPAPFDYVRIDMPEEACALLREHGDDARVLAGGQSLMPLLNMRLANPRLLLDISRCPALDYVRVDSRYLAVGAAATQGALERRPGLRAEAPLLAQAMPWISHFQVRNRGTVCGSIAHADPSAELPLCLLALDGEVLLRSHDRERSVKAENFFRGMLATDRRADELMVEARFPVAGADSGYAFDEFCLRHGDFAVAAAAAVVRPGRIRLAVGGVADRPAVIEWPLLEQAQIEAPLNDFAWSLGARNDSQASAAVRRHLVRHLGRNAVARARANLEESAAASA